VGREVRETVRDPHVLVFLLFPIVLYPLLLWASLQLSAADEGWRDAQSWRIDVDGPPELVDAVLADDTRVDAGPDPAAALDDGRVDLVVRTEVTTEDGADRWATELRYTATRPRSNAARRAVEARLGQLRQRRLAQRATAAGLTPEALDPYELRVEIGEGSKSLLGWIAGMLVSTLLPTSLLLSGLYPAIDIVVGERDRGTIETTLVSASSWRVLAVGRVVATIGFMLAGALGNAIGLSLTVGSLAVAFTHDASAVWIPPLSSLEAVPAVLATAAFVTGVLFVALLPARTFKEGEWLGSIVMMGALAPIVVAIAPLLGGEASLAVLALPMANTSVALARSIDGTARWADVVVPTLVNGGLALALLWFAARVVSSEDWLYGDRVPRWLGWIRGRAR
ncbi:MAG: hypothetical protein ABMB14_35140, partial [Myxococcota bacterium]